MAFKYTSKRLKVIMVGDNKVDQKMDVKITSALLGKLKKAGNTTININQYSFNVDKGKDNESYGELEVLALSLFDSLKNFVPERQVFNLLKFLMINALVKREGTQTKVADSLNMQRTYICRLMAEFKKEPYYKKLMETIALSEGKDGSYELPNKFE